jgi:phosphatidate phosphatase APP1
MSELYRHLATQGVSGFHYVSNSPYELLPVLQSFLSHHDFPSGFSLKVSPGSRIAVTDSETDHFYCPSSAKVLWW